MEKARQMGLKTIALTGGTGGKLKENADLSIVVPSKMTPRIQETH
ncbi:phosphoheptose isomerase, partial [mine drainage metagenome]